MAEKHESRAAVTARLSDERTVTTVTLSADTAAADALAGWPERLAASIAQQRERAAAKKAFRTEHQRRRQYAHPKRHAAKLEAHRG